MFKQILVITLILFTFMINAVSFANANQCHKERDGLLFYMVVIETSGLNPPTNCSYTKDPSKKVHIYNEAWRQKADSGPWQSLGMGLYSCKAKHLGHSEECTFAPADSAKTKHL
jgi:hypothetical protein